MVLEWGAPSCPSPSAPPRLALVPFFWHLVFTSVVKVSSAGWRGPSGPCSGGGGSETVSPLRTRGPDGEGAPHGSAPGAGTPPQMDLASAWVGRGVVWVRGLPGHRDVTREDGGTRTFWPCSHTVSGQDRASLDTWGAEGGEERKLRQPQSSPAPLLGSSALLSYRRIHLRAVGWKGTVRDTARDTWPGLRGCPGDPPEYRLHRVSPPGTGLGPSNALGFTLWPPVGHWDHTLASSFALGPHIEIQFCTGILHRTQ